jgi:CubicO group peptidase (beta-lactamase class C family)
MKKSVIMMTFLVIFAGCSSSSNTPDETDYSSVISETRAYVNENLAANGIMGASAALVDGNRLVWAEGFGYADKNADVKAAPDTIFEIGSVSKTLTTMALMQLVDEGKLDIDKPVETYIPEFGIIQRFTSLPITIRSMLTHHSGLPTDIFVGGFTVDAPDLTWTDWLAGYLEDEYTANPVGYSLAYSNTAFALLQKVIENVSGENLYTYTDKMFDFLGMSDSTFGTRNLSSGRLSKSYYIDEEQPFIYTNLSTSGSIRSTVLDMSKYMSNVLLARGGSLLKPETMNEIFTQQSTGSLADSTTKIGLCFFLNDAQLDYAGRLAWHNGATVSMSSHMTVLIDHGLGAIMLTNSAGGNGLAQSTVEKILKLALKAKKGIEPSAPADLPDSQPATPPAGLIDSITGYYIGEGGVYQVVDNHAGGINFIGPTRTATLGYLENGFWKEAGSNVQYEIRKVGQDRIMFYWSSVGNNARLGSLFRPQTIPAAWQARAGDWSISNMPADDSSWFVNQDIALVRQTLTLRIANGVLYMDGPLRTGMILDPQNDSLAFTAGIGRNRGESVRIDDSTGVEVLIVSGARYVKE